MRSTRLGSFFELEVFNLNYEGDCWRYDLSDTADRLRLYCLGMRVILGSIVKLVLLVLRRDDGSAESPTLQSEN